MTAISDAAAQAAIGAAARELKLPTVRDQAARLAEIAAREQATYLAYLAEVLAAELNDSSARRRARRIAEARFPRIKRLADFSIDAVPVITPALLARLASGAYLDHGEPVVLPGDNGTGKTHLLTGRGLAACKQGRRVRYVTTAALNGELVEAADQRTLSRVVGRYGRLDLLLLDEPRLRPGRPPRRRAAVPGHHRAGRTSHDRDRDQPPVQRMGSCLPRPPPGRRDRQPRPLRRAHPSKPAPSPAGSAPPRPARRAPASQADNCDADPMRSDGRALPDLAQTLVRR